MATFSKNILSESTDGKGIVIDTTTAGSGRPIHTAVASTADFDEVWIYACNSHTTSVTLTLEYGGTSSTERIAQPIDPSSGLYLVVCPVSLSKTERSLALTRPKPVRLPSMDL